MKEPIGAATPEELLEMLPQDIDTSDKSYVQPDAQLIIAGVNPKGFVPEDSELYTEHIDYFFDVQVGSTIMAFSEEDKNRLYEMLTEYADVFKKAIAVKIPLVEHILGNPWPPVEIAEDPEKQHIHCGTIDDCQIIADYETWKASRTK